MRKFALIAAIVFLLVPFAFISAESPISEYTAWDGFLYTGSDGNFWIVDLDRSGSIEASWFEDDGYFEQRFGNLWIVAMIALVMGIVGLVFAVIDDRKQKRSAILLLVASAIIIVLRFLELGDADLGFYEKDSSFFGEFTYLELPIGPILAIIFAFVDLSKD